MGYSLDHGLVSELLSRYRAAFSEEHYSGLWRDIFDQHQRPLHDVFMRGSAEEAAAILGNPVSNFLQYGFDNMFKGCPAGNNKDLSALRRLAEALGAENLLNPVHESADKSLAMKRRKFRRSMENAEDILSRIDRIRGRVEFPNPFPGESGTITKRGLASGRAVHAVYQASLLHGRVLEIGGGLGRTAYYAQRFGITDYTIVDLPFTGISQGYFLAATLGAHSVKLLSPDEFFASAETYDVALNVDSLTELSQSVAEKYIAAIQARAERFISINHESNAFTVRDLLGGRTSRHPDWLRPGYVEEHFQS